RPHSAQQSRLRSCSVVYCLLPRPSVNLTLTPVGWWATARRVLAIPGWTWKVEGLWMDLGTLDATGASSVSCICQSNPGAHLSGGQVTTHSHFTDGILRGGLNYRFY